MKNPNHSKKLLVLSFMLIAFTLTKAQQSIPNGNFEEWNTQTLLTPTGYVNSTLERPEYASLNTCERVSDAQNGNYAIRITTKKLPNENDRMPGYFANLVNEDGDPSTWHGGFPINEKPTGLKGYFKHDVKPGDSSFILAIFSKNGVNIGSYFYFIGGQNTAYTEFNFTFSPALTQTPDSMIFGAVSSNVFNDIAVEGSMLQLDNITLTGITSQPAQLNGNFENWSDVNIESPKNWYIETDNEMRSIKTSDHYKGSFGIKLESYLGEDEDNNKRAEESNISTGYYTSTSMEGGFPFSNITDTLLFWYKYTTAGSSKGAMYVTYKKNGNIVGGRRVELEPWNSDYKLVTYPLEIGTETPDTLIVTFSSLRNDIDRLNLSNASSVLYVDEVQLSSQKLNTSLRKINSNLAIRVYPNPATENLTVILPASVTQENISISIINQLGQEVLSSGLNQTESQLSFNGLKPGLYNYIIKSQDNIIKSNRLLIN